jgi:hypothetical protein
MGALSPSPNDLTAVALPWMSILCSIDAHQVVARAERAVGVDEERWADEQRDAAHAGRRIGQRACGLPRFIVPVKRRCTAWPCFS